MIRFGDIPSLTFWKSEKQQALEILVILFKLLQVPAVYALGEQAWNSSLLKIVIPLVFKLRKGHFGGEALHKAGSPPVSKLPAELRRSSAVSAETIPFGFYVSYTKQKPIKCPERRYGEATSVNYSP